MTRALMVGAALVTALAGPARAAEPEARPIADAVARLALDAGAMDGAGWPAAAGWDAGAGGRSIQDRQPGDDAPPTRSRANRVGRANAGAAVGAVGGAFAGGYLGAAIDGDSGGCDDPGLKGFLIGFPVGGVVGGVLGGFFLFR
jgi:hypothetical protein